MKTQVSVVVPTYNQSKLLSETIDSILSQRYEPFEIVILDDGSTDDTKYVVSKMPGKVKYFFKPNGGICAARNAGVSFAESPYIAFCDHDDLWRDDKLEQQMELHNQKPDLKYSFTNFSIISGGNWSQATKFDEAPDEFFDSIFSPLGQNLLCSSSLYVKLLQFHAIFPSTVVIEKAFYESQGGEKEKFGRNPAQDMDLTLRCVLHPPLGVVTDAVVGIRKHATNFSGNSAKTSSGVIEILTHALEQHKIDHEEKEAVIEQLVIVRLAASFDAFSHASFAYCERLLSAVPKNRLSHGMRIKMLISRLPYPIAKALHTIVSGRRWGVN
jgi:glycosyltransferase involved in cell wall biosynthesis